VADKFGRLLHDRRQIFVGRFYWQTKLANFIVHLTCSPLLFPQFKHKHNTNRRKYAPTRTHNLHNNNTKLEWHSAQNSANAMSIFFRCFRQVAALYSAEVCPIWQWQRILQSYPWSRCWSGSPPKSNHLWGGPSL